MKILIILLVLLFLILQVQKKEHFVDANFKLCSENDCGCLKLNTAPDGSCVKYDIANPPLIPEYENKKIFKSHVVRNNLYPKKKNNNIVIFVGVKMVNGERRYNNLPTIFRNNEKKDDSIYSTDKKCNHYYDVFVNANNILSALDGKKPYLKWLILSADNFGNDKDIIKSYQIDPEIVPAIYLYNETTNKIKQFKIEEGKDRCFVLQDLLIFIADGDCGLISYLNHLEDPFLGMKFYHDSKNNRWLPDDNLGVNLYNNNTDMCKLIDYQDLTDNFKCK